MITDTMVKDAKTFLVKAWGEDGVKVIEECGEHLPLNMDICEFLDHCTACGGNWGGMLLTGLHKLRPSVWEAIPIDMGDFPFQAICDTLILCGVDTSE